MVLAAHCLLAKLVCEIVNLKCVVDVNLVLVLSLLVVQCNLQVGRHSAVYLFVPDKMLSSSNTLQI